jgi:hypothetical protein
MFASLDDLLLFDPTSINSVPIQLFVGLFDIHIVPGENNLHQTHKQQEQPPGLVLCGWLFVCLFQSYGRVTSADWQKSGSESSRVQTKRERLGERSVLIQHGSSQPTTHYSRRLLLGGWG